MNVLFVNYGDFTSNSLNHISVFANRLTLLGHSCVVAVPEKPETISVIAEPLFTAATFARLLGRTPVFPNRRGADLVHAWTPRENVREFTLAYLREHPNATLIIHLEDNEVVLMESFAGEPISKLRLLTDEELAARLSPKLSHPVRFRNFLRVAHAATYITDRLREFVPEGKPVHRLLPGINADLYRPQNIDTTLRETIGVGPHEKLIVFTGSTTFANLADVRSLLLAVRLINERGTPCKLVRTGINPPELNDEIAALAGDHVIDLGFIEKARLGALLASADVLVQPGAADDFNDYRLPSKIPEFMCVGRPVVIPNANLAREMTDGHHALLLQTGNPNEIADQCLRVFADPDLARRLGEGALEFARTHFDAVANTDWLLSFYERVRATASPIFTDPLTPASEDALLVDGDLMLRMRAKEDSIRLARAENARLRALESQLQSEVQAARHEAELLRAQLNEVSQANTRLMKFADAADKVHRMTNSFSWQITSPLRTFRRKWIDPKKRVEKVITTRVPPLDPSLTFGVDEPADWKQLSPVGTIRGWVTTTNGTQIVGVRARTADRMLDAVYGLMRPDIAAANPQQPYTLHSGFSLEYQLVPETTQVIVLEALTNDGRWRCFAAPTANLGRHVPDHERRDYATWVRRFDGPTLDQTVERRARIEALKPEQRILLSVILPVYDTPEAWLIKAIESVRNQIYPHWELCIANDASPAPHVRRILDDFVRKDSRIKVIHRDRNGHISAASNSALNLVTGEFVALLDHDDELAPHALAEIVFALIEKPSLDYLYSDEDKIDEVGRRFDPYFKPDWNPDLLLGQNYTCHLSVYRTTLLRELGGFREGFDGSQDWDLTLRATAKLPTDRIHHIAKILYHWRAIPGSTALVIDGKQDYPFIAAEKALKEHLQRTGTKGELIPVEGRHWRIKRRTPEIAPKVSIIVPTKNASDLLRLCLTTLLAKTTYPNFELIVVNNQSDDAVALAYFDELRRSGVTVLDFDATFNFSALNNFAVRHAQGEVLAFLNNDVEVITPDWLQEMVGQAIRPEIGAVGAMLYYPDDTIQHAGAVLGLTGIAGKEGVAGHAFKGFKRGSEGQRNRLRLAQNYSAVTAACLVIRRSVFEQVGGFNERDLPVAFNDIDLCLRVRKAGYRNLWTPFAEFYHHESASRGLEDTPEKVQRFHGEVTYMRRTWSRLLDADPAYNPNLSLQHEDFSLAFPPR